MVRSIVRALAVAAVAGCASAGPADRTDRNIITADQIAGTRAQNAYDAVQTLHPDWLTSRGPTSVTDPTPTAVSVYVNGIQMGGAEALRSIQIVDVIEIRYFAAGPAAARFGMGHPRGVIEVTTKT